MGPLRAFAAGLLLAAGCGTPDVGACQGSFCGQGNCSSSMVCTDACKRVPVTPGTACPSGYACLGLVTCVSHDLALPPPPDYRVIHDMTMPPPEDMSAVSDDAAFDMSGDASD